MEYRLCRGSLEADFVKLKCSHFITEFKYFSISYFKVTERGRFYLVLVSDHCVQGKHCRAAQLVGGVHGRKLVKSEQTGNRKVGRTLGSVHTSKLNHK